MQALGKARMSTRALLAGIAALFLATGTAQATERTLIYCAGQFFEVYGHHGYSFSRSDVEHNDGPGVSSRLFRHRDNGTIYGVWFYRGRKCVIVEDLLVPERLLEDVKQ
jgi:hypothetical protein